MASQTVSPPDPLAPDVDDDALAVLAEDFLDSILSAASVDVIGVANWWPRATSALTAAAARATCLRDMVTVTTSKLQVETLPEAAGRQITRLEGLLADPGVFARWRRICERDAVYVAAMVRLRRADNRAAKKPKPVVAKAAVIDEEPMF